MKESRKLIVIKDPERASKIINPSFLIVLILFCFPSIAFFSLATILLGVIVLDAELANNLINNTPCFLNPSDSMLMLNLKRSLDIGWYSTAVKMLHATGSIGVAIKFLELAMTWLVLQACVVVFLYKFTDMPKAQFPKWKLGHFASILIIISVFGLATHVFMKKVDIAYSSQEQSNQQYNRAISSILDISPAQLATAPPDLIVNKLGLSSMDIAQKCPFSNNVHYLPQGTKSYIGELK